MSSPVLSGYLWPLGTAGPGTLFSAIAVSEADRLAADAVTLAYSDSGDVRLLLDGFISVVRTLVLQRITDSGDYSEEAIAAELRSMLTGVFAERS